MITTLDLIYKNVTEIINSHLRFIKSNLSTFRYGKSHFKEAVIEINTKKDPQNISKDLKLYCD